MPKHPDECTVNELIGAAIVQLKRVANGLEKQNELCAKFLEQAAAGEQSEKGDEIPKPTKKEESDGKK